MSATVTTKVRNLISIDDAPMNKMIWLVAITAFGGIFVDGYILGVIGTAIGPAAQELSLTPLGQGLIASSALIGIFIAGPFFGGIADRFGRKRVFFWNLVGFTAVSFAQLFVVGTWDLFALRLLLGMLIGVEYAVGTALLAEFTPKLKRSVLLGSISLFWFAGFVAAFVVGHFWEPSAWRWLLASSAIPALITLLLRLRVPESPRWLQSQGRDEEAQAIITRHWGADFTLPDIPLSKERTTLATFFRENDWRRILYSGLFWFCQVGPLFAIFTFITPVLDSLGVNNGFSTDLVMNGVQMLGAVLGLWLLYKLTRRFFVISTFGATLFFLLLLGLWPNMAPMPALIIFGAFVLIITASNNIQYVYPPEMYETRFRSTGVGMAAAISRVGAAGATYLFPLTLSSLGVSATLIIAAAFPLVGLITSIMWAPETKHIDVD